MKRQDKYPDTPTFHYYNANPRGRVTGDCVVRAICTAMKRPYEEVYEELYQFSVKYGYMLNDKKCYEKYLAAQGWRKMPQPRKADGTKYTGKEWCEKKQRNIFTRAIRAIAHIGGGHIVAVVEGKVWDTWNSTGGCIGNFWVKG